MFSPRQAASAVGELFSPRKAKSKEARKKRGASKYAAKEPASSTPQSLMDDLRSGSEQERAAALTELANQMDYVHGNEAMELGQVARDSGGIVTIIELVSHPEPYLHQLALYVLGNLSSDAVDAQSWRTKLVVREVRGFERVLTHAWSDDIDTLYNALGAIQNLCTFPEYARQMEAPPSHRRRHRLPAPLHPHTRASPRARPAARGRAGRS